MAEDKPNVRTFLKRKPHVVVTNHGCPGEDSVTVDGKEFPAISVEWKLGRGHAMPEVTLTFYARLEVQPFKEET